MFWIKHPKPFIQRPVAMQVVARKAQSVPDLHVIIVETPAEPGADVIQPGPAGPRAVSDSGAD